MSVTLEVASKAGDAGLGAYVKDLDERLARPSETVTPISSAPGAAPAPAEKPKPVVSGDDVLPAVSILGKVITTRAEVAKLTPDETRDIADALAPVANKYAGGLFAQYAEETALAFVLYMVAQPRLEEWRRRKRLEDEAAAADAEARAGDQPEPMTVL